MSTGYAGVAVRGRAEASGLTGYLRRLDWVLLSAAFALSIFGSLLVWSATKERLTLDGSDPQFYLQRQLLNLTLGIVLGFAVSRFDYRLLRAYTPVLYVASVVGLIAVLSPLGRVVNGTKGWILLPGGFTIQPAEFAKLALIVGVALILAEKADNETEPRDRDVILAIALAAVPMVLVLRQPDLGTVVIMGTILLGMLAVAGVKARWIIGVCGTAILGAYVAVTVGVVKQYQLDRLTAFTNPDAGSRTFGLNTQQARIAIGSGGVTGQGLFEGQQTQGGFVPFNYTDFVYSVAGEEFGFIGAVGVIIAVAVIVWRALAIAARAHDLFGRLVAVGVACWICFQAFENIGMNLGIMPVTGVPLPFVSYGGSSMFACWMAIGLLLNVHLGRSTR